jgi:hypothetical protein
VELICFKDVSVLNCFDDKLLECNSINQALYELLGLAGYSDLVQASEADTFGPPGFDVVKLRKHELGDVLVGG